MTLLKSAISAVALAFASASAGAAATYDIDPQNSSSVFKDRTGANAWAVTVTRTIEGHATPSLGVYAGMFRLTEGLHSPADRDFLAFCLSPGVLLNLGVDYAAGIDLSDTTLGALGALRNNAFSLVTNSITAGAFQIAVWEIVMESAGYDLTSGLLRISSSRADSQNAIALATDWLGNIQSGSWAASTGGMRFHKAQGSSQDLLEIAPVPLPASGLLLLGGLAGALGWSRRKRA